MRGTTPTFDFIDHNGIIEKTDSHKKSVTVRIERGSDCGSCPAAKICSPDGKNNNILNVSTPDADKFTAGEKVIVRGTERMHRRAIILAAVIPSLLLVTSMTGIYIISRSQPLAALSGLAMMLIFFIVLYLLRNRLSHEFKFFIIKQNTNP